MLQGVPGRVQYVHVQIGVVSCFVRVIGNLLSIATACLSLKSVCVCTGVGRHSDPIQGPVLHDTVRKLLNEELKLTTDDAGRPNPGCLVINRQTLQQWLASRKHKAIS